MKRKLRVLIYVFTGVCLIAVTFLATSKRKQPRTTEPNVRIDTNTMQHYQAQPVEANFRFIEYDDFLIIISLDYDKKEMIYLDRVEGDAYKTRDDGKAVMYRRGETHIYMMGFGFNIRYSIDQVLHSLN